LLHGKLEEQSVRHCLPLLWSPTRGRQRTTRVYSHSEKERDREREVPHLWSNNSPEERESFCRSWSFCHSSKYETTFFGSTSTGGLQWSWNFLQVPLQAEHWLVRETPLICFCLERGKCLFVALVKTGAAGDTSKFQHVMHLFFVGFSSSPVQSMFGL